MLDQKVFLQGINYLKANYINWGFDLNNDLMLKVWYKKFSNLEDGVFMGLIEKHTELNKYPPNSPAELLELLREQMTQKELDAGEAWEYVRHLIQKYGFYYGAAKIYAEIEDKPALLKTVKQFEGELRGLQTSDTYTPERFKSAYAINVKRQIANKSSLLLGTANILMLE